MHVTCAAVVEGNCEVILDTMPSCTNALSSAYFSAYRSKKRQPKASTKNSITVSYRVGTRFIASCGSAHSPSPVSRNKIVAGRLAKQYESYSGLTKRCENFALSTAGTEAAFSITIPLSVRTGLLYAVQYII